MIVSIHQPAYLPWLGYLHKILLSDVFVVLDTVQYEKNSFINRNRIRTQNGDALWLTVPVKRAPLKSNVLSATEIDNGTDWREKHWQTIELNYKKTPYFNLYKSFFENYYRHEWRLINDLCKKFLDYAVSEMKINTKIIYASGLPKFETKKSDLVLDICNYLKADIYVSGALGRGYLEEKRFSNEKIKIYYQSFSHPTYKQRFGEFASNLSLIDAWFNIGAEATKGIIIQDNYTKERLLNSI